MNINPPAEATGRKRPLRIRAAMKDSNEPAPAAQPVVTNAAVTNQNGTGARPKYADRVTATTEPTPSMNTLAA